MPFSQGYPASLDVPCHTARAHRVHLIRDAVWLTAVIIMSCCLWLTVPPAAADDVAPKAVEESHCGEDWPQWEDLLAKNPGNLDLHALYALRVGLCVEVGKGRISVKDGAVIFERARKAPLQQLGRPRAKPESKL